MCLFASMENNPDIIPISKYRRILADHASSDKAVKERLSYLEGFCRSIIQEELEKHRRKIYEK